MSRFHRTVQLSMASCLLLAAEIRAGEGRAPAASLPAAEIAQRQNAAMVIMKRWLAAQNQADFDAYMALYAPRFRGVRRSRLQAVRLDRAGWAKDRAKMFTRPMKVEAEHIQTLPGKSMIKVLFTQHWSSGKYSDVGPKRIILVERNGAWRIAEEEMLASHPPGELQLAPGTASGQLAFVEDGEVILAGGQNLCDGPSKLDEGGSWSHVIRCPVKPVSIPKQLSAWRTERVTLYDKDGEGCTTRLTDFEMVGRGSLMSGIDDELDGRDGVSERRHLAAVWRHTAALLVGKGTGCTGDAYVWARLASLPKPVRARISDVPANLVRRAKRAFHRLPAWAKDQAECGADGKDWEDLATENHQSLISFRIAAERYVSIMVKTGDCSGSCGQLFGLFQVGGKGKQASFAPVFTDSGERTLQAAFDSDGDGRLEFLYREIDEDISLTLLAPDKSGNLEPTFSVAVVTIMGCRC